MCKRAPLVAYEAMECHGGNGCADVLKTAPIMAAHSCCCSSRIHALPTELRGDAIYGAIPGLFLAVFRSTCGRDQPRMRCAGLSRYVEEWPMATLFRQSPLNAIWEGRWRALRAWVCVNSSPCMPDCELAFWGACFVCMLANLRAACLFVCILLSSGPL